MKTAILVDGGFYRRRAQIKIGEKSAAERANELDGYCRRHLIEKHQTPHELYRIFYYDCPPMNKKVYHPFLKQQIDFSKSELNVWMTQFLSELKQHRKFALRLGKLADAQACYTLRIDVVKKLCSCRYRFVWVKTILNILRNSYYNGTSHGWFRFCFCGTFVVFGLFTAFLFVLAAAEYNSQGKCKEKCWY